MKLQTLHKAVGLAILTAVVVGGLAVATGKEGVGGDESAAVTQMPYGTDGDSFNSVASQVDQALGRGTSGEGAVRNAVPGAAPAPLVLESRGAKDAIAPAPPMAASAPQTGVGGGTTGSPGGAPLQTADDRKIVQTASMRLQVKEVNGGFQEVSRIATSSGGFVASSSFAYEGNIQVASVTVRVPAARYQEVLSQLRGLATKVDAENSNASDVTEEYSDLGARLRNLEATETTLLGFLAQAKNVSEVLQVQDRLNTTRSEIERVKGRMNLLDKLTDMATITTHLRPSGAPGTTSGDGGGLGVTVREAWDDSLAFLEDVAAAVLTVVVFAWWLPLVAVPVYIAYQRFGRRLPVASRD